MTNEMVLAKVVHPGAIKLSSGMLSGPVNRIIKMSQSDADMLQARGVKITVLSKVIKKSNVVSAEELKNKRLTPVSKPTTEDVIKEEDNRAKAEAEAKKKAKEQAKAKQEKEAKEKAEAEAKAKLEAEQKEAVIEENGDEEEGDDGTVTVEYIEECDDLKELRGYAEKLGLNPKLNKKQLRKAIIKELQN